jgi:hypothetical protein
MIDMTYEWIGWVLIAIGTIGCFLPVLPGPPIAYAALFLALARGDHASPEVSTLVVAGAVMAAVLVLDWIVPTLGAKKFNGSRLGMFGCFVGTIAGLFFLPLGVVLGPFIGAFAGEILSGKTFGPSLKGAFGALLGYACGVALKVACCGFIAYQFWTAVRGA